LRVLPTPHLLTLLKKNNTTMLPSKTIRSSLMLIGSLIGSLVVVGADAKNAEARIVEMCNYSTSNRIYLAAAVYLDGDWYVRGWLHLDQGDCERIYHEGSTFYYYGDGSDRSEWSGERRFCVLDREFKILSRNDCDNGRWERFVRKTGLDDFYRIRLTD
jgi:uncharacterized membrane protein